MTRAIVLRLAALAAASLLVGTPIAASAESLQPVPPLKSRVTDLTGTLTAAEQAGLETRLAEFEARKGAQIAVLIVPTTKPEEIEQFSIRVVDAWKLGREKPDDGALLLVAMEDRTLRIEVGRGLEGALTDLVSNRIIDETITPRFREGDFSGGISAGVDRMISVVDGEPLPEPEQHWSGGARGLGDVLPVLFGLVFFGSVVLRALFGRALGSVATGRRRRHDRMVCHAGARPLDRPRLRGTRHFADARLRQRRPLVEPARARRMDDGRLGRRRISIGRWWRVRRRRRQLWRRRRVGPLVIMQLARTLRHLFSTRWGTRRRFTPAVLARIEQGIARLESRHAGEIRFAVETAFDLPELWYGLTPRQRALVVFGQLGVWDTDGNNGVLIYVLMADHDVEIVADRAIAARVPQAEWDAVCRDMESHFRAGRFAEGAESGIAGVGRLLGKHFPGQGGDRDEQPDQPVLL